MSTMRQPVMPGSRALHAKARRCPKCGSHSFYDDADVVRCLSCSTPLEMRRARIEPRDREPYAQLLIVMPAVLKTLRAREARADTPKERQRLREQRLRVEAACAVLTQAQDLSGGTPPKDTPGLVSLSNHDSPDWPSSASTSSRLHDTCADCGEPKAKTRSEHCPRCAAVLRWAARKGTAA